MYALNERIKCSALILKEAASSFTLSGCERSAICISARRKGEFFSVDEHKSATTDKSVPTANSCFCRKFIVNASIADKNKFSIAAASSPLS